jgi:hypothetical protein
VARQSGVAVSWNLLRGITGEFEITRVLGAGGVAIYIVGAHVFEAYTVWGLGKPFDITAYCLAFPTGLGTAIAAVGFTAGQKDKAVATAKVTQAVADNAQAATP